MNPLGFLYPFIKLLTINERSVFSDRLFIFTVGRSRTLHRKVQGYSYVSVVYDTLRWIRHPYSRMLHIPRSREKLAHLRRVWISSRSEYPSFSSLRSSCQGCTDYVCTVNLTVSIKMTVYIRGCSHIRVTEPILDHLHRYLVCE